MLQKRLFVVIVSLLAGSLTLGQNLVKSQTQTPSPSQLAAPLSSNERLNYWSRTSPNEPIPAGVFFAQRIPDAQILQLMRRYNVQLKAVYMSVAGMSGTHRAYNNEDAKTVIAEARRITTEIMLNSRKSSQVRARDFVKLHPRKQFLAQSANETPRIDAWSLLRNIEQDEAALAWSQGNQPLIYGVEVVGSINNIKKLATDPIVKGFEPGVKVNGRIIIPRSSLPEQVVTSQDLGVRSQAIPQTAEEIYTRIENIARYGIK